MGLRRFAQALVVMLTVLGVAVGLVSGFFAGAAERGLYATGLWSTNGPSTVPPGTFEEPVSTATPSAAGDTDGLPSPVLPSEIAARAPSAARVTARLDAVDARGMGGRFSGQVSDLTTGKVLYAHRAGSPAVPASATKLLTAAAALSLLGSDHAFRTEVVRSGPGRLVLVGGGDPYLATTAPKPGEAGRASLAALAADTSAELKRGGTTKVTLGYDASLFSGPAWNPGWPRSYADQVTPVSALWADRGRVAGVSPGPRVANPAQDAARAFARALEKRGLTVTRIARAKAPASAAPVATATSTPLEQVVERLLLASDNDAAEVLLRHVALADDRPGSSTEGTRAVQRELDRLGVWPGEARMQDGSGLARSTQVPARTLVELVRLAADPEHPELRGLLTGLPVAGTEGSLRSRHSDEQSWSGRGVVRGKTGTLTGVHALAGYLRTQDQHLVAFAFLVNDATNDYEAKVWLDRVTAALSRCGC